MLDRLKGGVLAHSHRLLRLAVAAIQKAVDSCYTGSFALGVPGEACKLFYRRRCMSTGEVLKLLCGLVFYPLWASLA